MRDGHIRRADRPGQAAWPGPDPRPGARPCNVLPPAGHRHPPGRQRGRPRDWPRPASRV